MRVGHLKLPRTRRRTSDARIARGTERGGDNGGSSIRPTGRVGVCVRPSVFLERHVLQPHVQSAPHRERPAGGGLDFDDATIADRIRTCHGRFARQSGSGRRIADVDGRGREGTGGEAQSQPEPLTPLLIRLTELVQRNRFLTVWLSGLFHRGDSRQFGSGMVISSWILYVVALYIVVDARIEDFPSVGGKDIIVTGALNAGGFITTEKKAHVSGLRVETEAGEEGFIGYTDKGVSIVQPDTEVRVVIFGWWLDEVSRFTFTDHDNCTDTEAEVNQADFTIQTEKRVVIKYSFLPSDNLYKMCMKPKPREGKDGKEIELSYALVEDLKTAVSTNLPPRKYYFPMMIQIAIITCLLVLSGLFSGLNLGLMSLTPQELTLISNSGSLTERRYAEAILPIRKSGNYLLCSLLIGNVMVNSAISILFDDLTSGYIALIVSSAGIVIFGEIFPQSLCVKKGLAVGAKTIWITRFFMMITSPLAYPISKVLDLVLGDEVVSYDRKRLMEMIKLSTRNEAGLAEELKIAVGAMEISDKTVADVMTKMNDVFMLPDDTVLNTKTVAEILRMGYTRIPVFAEDRNNVVSLLFVKDLALLDPDDNFTVKTVCGYHEHALRFVLEDTPLRVMLEEFKKGEYHLAMVQRIKESNDSDPVYEVTGVVTLEDIVEEILQAEIVDETDAITDNVHRTVRRRPRGEDYNSHFLANENCSFQISMQMQFVTMQWLTTNVTAFTQKYVNRNVLERIIRQHVHKVEFSHLSAHDSKVVLPRQKIYKKKEPSDKFILILEGRMMVTIGQNEMNFEAGPWHYFGMEILDRIVKNLDNLTPGQVQSPSSTAPAPPVVASPTVTQRSSISSRLQRGSSVRASHGALVPILNSGGTAAPGGVMSEFDKKTTFMPDFSVTIQEDCTYLEVTAQTYLLAYKTTLISRGSGRETADGHKPDHFASSGDLNHSPIHRIKEEEGNLSNGGLTSGHKRSSSESHSANLNIAEDLRPPASGVRRDSGASQHSDSETAPLNRKDHV